MENLFVVTLFISPILWIISIKLTKNWKHFKKLALLNLLIFVCYFFILNFTKWIDLGDDAYGLGRLVTNVILIMIHVILGFISSLIIYKKMKVDNA